jgi:ACT domain-containing protein
MLVQDFVRTTPWDTPSILVPPFHTGHLGLIAGTTVNVNLVPTGSVNPLGHAELVITPLPLPELVRLTATLRDEIGVVARLVDAVAKLGINIEVQESSSITNRLGGHYADLILDMSEAAFDDDPDSVSQRAREYYRRYDSNLPTGDPRLVQIFEAVVAHCADVLTSREIGGVSTLNLTIRPLPPRAVKTNAQVTVQKTPTSLHGEIKLPDGIADEIRNMFLRIRGNDASELHYIFSSDTDARDLRVFFLRHDVVTRVLHVGIRHNNTPGALAAILQLVADSSFNILTSLLRKSTPLQSVWEGVLEYRGDADLLPKHSLSDNAHYRKTLKWFREILDTRAQSIGLGAANIEIGRPLYYSHVPASAKIEWMPLLHSSNPEPLLKRDQTMTVLLDARRSALLDVRHNGRDHGERDVLLELVNQVAVRLSSAKKPSIFLSYPANARGHAELVKSRIYALFGDIAEYQYAEGERVSDAIIERIQRCDYFIGIWHHDERLPLGDGEFDMSPWLHFEYGVALAANTKCLVVHSHKLAERVWRRVRPDDANREYVDLSFASETCQHIVEHCQRYFQ